MTWFGISFTYIRFYQGLKVQGIDRKTLPYASRLQPFPAWYAMCFCLLICFVSSELQSGLLHTHPEQFSGWKVFLKGKWDTATFITNYLPLALFPILYVGAYLKFRQPMVSPSQMDFVSDLAEIEAEVYVLPPFCSVVADAYGLVDTMSLHRKIRWKPSGLGW
jgi:yeast amino acid transporter